MGRFEIEVDLSVAAVAEIVDLETTAGSEGDNQSVETVAEGVDSEMFEDSEVGKLWAEAVVEELEKVAPEGFPGLGALYIAVAMEHWQSPFAVVQIHKTAAAALGVYCRRRAVQTRLGQGGCC